MLKIARLETFVIGDGPEIDPEGGVEPLACPRVHTDDGLVGPSEVFRVPPGVDRGRVLVVQSYRITCGELTETKRVGDFAVPRGALVRH